MTYRQKQSQAVEEYRAWERNQYGEELPLAEVEKRLSSKTPVG